MFGLGRPRALDHNAKVVDQALGAVPARADEQSEFKEKFKAGCASANGSWIEDADREGQYQCNAPRRCE